MEEPKLRDYYKDLGVTPESTSRGIKLAFNRLAKLHHPDKTGDGGSNNAEEFRRVRVREAQETLCDEEMRKRYDQRYSTIRAQWAHYRETQEDQRLQNIRAAELAARKMAEAEKARRVDEKIRRMEEKARQDLEREAERMLHELKRKKADGLSRETARRARVQQEQEAKDRLRKHMESEANARSKEVAQKAKERHEMAAKERLAESQMRERQDALQRNWAQIRARADGRLKHDNNLSHNALWCQHPLMGWPRKKGRIACYSCGRACGKFSFRCPKCDTAACANCTKRQSLY
ncbi:hypothetical protein BJ875DRAFT_379340 [Amylocarpus encephaloides]|uniref:J domain-containing protein n=1 Tax=Amylocarpus encephaloides TaxID=45428 RepID=A0A9P7YFR7_9HELO|nr:hypothetical protein BJ875DRAFT_379340 [Amylocarpus encephaloides]